MNKLPNSMRLMSLFLVVAVTGCSRPQFVPASGKLTKGGKPVAQATVMFHYGGGDSAVGITDDQGKFSLTFNGNPGARPGKQIGVTVAKRQSPYEGISEPRPEGSPPPAARGPGPTPKGTPTGPGKNLLPDEYADANNPKLTLDVPEGGSDKLDIALP